VLMSGKFMIKDITKTSLSCVLPLLKTSYPGVSLDDEIEYFPKNDESLGWCYYESNQRPSSFLRYFIQGESPKFATFEFVVPKNHIKEFNALSDYCLTRATPLKNIMQRFEFSEDQKSFIPNLKKFGFDETVTYLTYEKDLSDGSFNHLIDVAENDFQQVNDCLSCFQIFSTEKLKELVESRCIHCLKINDDVVSSAWVKFDKDRIELLEIATHSDDKKKGYAKKLLKSVEGWGFQQGYKRVLLKVKEGNLPAINLYQSLSYTNNINLKEYWVYRNKS